jgi:hypothetical protein
MKERICNSCLESYPENFFGVDNSQPDQMNPTCRLCCAQRTINSRKAIREREEQGLEPRWKWQPEPTVPVKIDHFPKSQSLGSAAAIIFKTAPKRFRRAWNIG